LTIAGYRETSRKNLFRKFIKIVPIQIAKNTPGLVTSWRIFMQPIVINQITPEEIEAIVRKVVGEFNTHALPERDSAVEWGDVELASRVTGLAKSTIYSLTSRRLIPHAKKGKRLYFNEKELLTWIDQGRRRTRSEITKLSRT
jgi:hypothetical protein